MSDLRPLDVTAFAEWLRAPSAEPLHEVRCALADVLDGADPSVLDGPLPGCMRRASSLVAVGIGCSRLWVCGGRGTCLRSGRRPGCLRTGSPRCGLTRSTTCSPEPCIPWPGMG